MNRVVVRGCGDVGSAVAHVLFQQGYSVVLHDSPRPAHSRRGMAFVDALYEGISRLAGVLAKRARDPEDAKYMLGCRRAIPVADGDMESVIAAVAPGVVVDARMRKRMVPESQRGLAPLSIGLGPNYEAGQNADIVIETGWGDDLGAVIREGETRPLQGEPRRFAGLARERFVYASVPGVFRTSMGIGDTVLAGQQVGLVNDTPICAPVGGVLRGLSHDGAVIEANAKIVEVDPRGEPSSCFGLGERPTKIAAGVLTALTARL